MGNETFRLFSFPTKVEMADEEEYLGSYQRARTRRSFRIFFRRS